MRNAFPDAKGFSDTNVKYMKRWYLFYYEQLVENQQSDGLLADSKGQQPVDQLLMDKKSHQLGDQIEVTEKCHQLGDILEMPDTFGLVPWKHHILIISMSQSVDEALFYINQVIQGNWSRARLETEIHSNLYRRQGTAISNFSAMLPTTQGQLAQEILKDPYNISFLGRKDVQDEKELQQANRPNRQWHQASEDSTIVIVESTSNVIDIWLTPLTVAGPVQLRCISSMPSVVTPLVLRPFSAHVRP